MTLADRQAGLGRRRISGVLALTVAAVRGRQRVEHHVHREMHAVAAAAATVPGAGVAVDRQAPLLQRREPLVGDGPDDEVIVDHDLLLAHRVQAGAAAVR